MTRIAKCTYTVEFDLDDPDGICQVLGVMTIEGVRGLLQDDIADGAYAAINASDFDIEITEGSE